MTKKVELFSGRVLKVPSDKVSADRYKWLKLSEAEPDLGVPPVEGAFVYSSTTGERSWSSVLRTNSSGVLFTGTRIQSGVEGQDLEIGTTNDSELNVRITSNLIVDGDFIVQGNFSAAIDAISLPEGGTVSIGNETVLTSTELGTGVVNSNLQTVGEITQGTWRADPIGTEYGGTGIGVVGEGVVENAILYGNGINPMHQLIGEAYQVLQIDENGVPKFGDMDGGEY